MYYDEEIGDNKRAKKYFRKSARLGVPEAKLALALMIDDEQNWASSEWSEIPIKTEVLKYYQEAALEIPSPIALNTLGRIYSFGRKNVKIDIELAYHCYELAVCLGDKSSEETFQYLNKNIEKLRGSIPQWFSNGNQAFKKALEERLVQYKKMQAIAHYKKNTCS